MVTLEHVFDEVRALRRVVERLTHQQPTTGPQRRLLDALLGEFADGPFTSREVLRAAASPLKHHDALRAALAENKLSTAQDIGQALRPLPGVIRCKSERGAAVWAIGGHGPL